MAFCICCQSEVDIVARVTHAGLPMDISSWDLQRIVSGHAWDRYGLALECDDDPNEATPWDVCYRCYVSSGAERYYPFSILPQYRY